MALSPEAKKIWIETQKKHSEPVNALGMKINPKDQEILKIWKAEGIDKFVKR